MCIASLSIPHHTGINITTLPKRTDACVRRQNLSDSKGLTTYKERPGTATTRGTRSRQRTEASAAATDIGGDARDGQDGRGPEPNLASVGGHPILAAASARPVSYRLLKRTIAMIASRPSRRYTFRGLALTS